MDEPILPATRFDRVVRWLFGDAEHPLDALLERPAVAFAAFLLPMVVAAVMG